MSLSAAVFAILHYPTRFFLIFVFCFIEPFYFCSFVLYVFIYLFSILVCFVFFFLFLFVSCLHSIERISSRALYHTIPYPTYLPYLPYLYIYIILSVARACSSPNPNTGEADTIPRAVRVWPKELPLPRPCRNFVYCPDRGRLPPVRWSKWMLLGWSRVIWYRDLDDTFYLPFFFLILK